MTALDGSTRSPTLTRRTSGRFALAAMSNAAALGVVYWVCVRTAVGQRHEDAIHALASGTRRSVRTPEWLLSVIEQVQVHHLLFGLVLITTVGLLRRQWRLAARGLAVALGTLGVTEILKLVVLQRPDLTDEYGSIATNSLPSGHTSAALGLALGLLLVAPRWLRAPVAVLGGLAAGAMGSMVIDDGWHRVSDVLASALLGATVFALVTAVRPHHGRRERRPSGVLALALGVPLLSAAALAVVYLLPGAGLATACAVPGLVVAMTVLLAAASFPAEDVAR